MKTLMKEKLLETTTEEVGRGRVSEEGRADRSDEGVQRVEVEGGVIEAPESSSLKASYQPPAA